MSGNNLGELNDITGESYLRAILIWGWLSYAQCRESYTYFFRIKFGLYYVGGLMVDYRKVIEGSRYATIFNRMDGGKGLMVAAQSFVSKAL